MISGTNLLTRCIVPVACFLLFFVLEKSENEYSRNWTGVACQNPPASSDGQHGEPGGSQDCWWALVPRATARKTPAHVLAWFEGVPPDLYLVRKVKDCFDWFPAW